MKKTLVFFLCFLIIILPLNSRGKENLEEFFCIDLTDFPLCGTTSRLEDNGSWLTFHEINLFSGDMDKAWVVGEPGDGIGEKIWFEIDLGIKELLVINGHRMLNSSYEDNNRVKTAELQIWAAINKPGMVTEIGGLFYGIPASPPFQVELEDCHEIQYIKIEQNWEQVKKAMDDLLEKVGEVLRYAYLITLEIKDIFPGDKKGNTGITEISWNLLPEYAGPGGLGIFDLRGVWKNQEGSKWDSLELEWYPYYQGWTSYIDGEIYDAGTWEIGEGMLMLYSDSKQEQFFFSGFPLGYNLLLLIGEEGQMSFWNKE